MNESSTPQQVANKKRELAQMFFDRAFEVAEDLQVVVRFGRGRMQRQILLSDLVLFHPDER